jgi:hypothetical protein
VYKLRKMRRRVTSEERMNAKLGKSSTLADYLRRNFGIREEEFVHGLFRSEFWIYWYNIPFQYLYIRLRPEYFNTF